MPPIRLAPEPGVVEVKVSWPMRARAAWPDEKSAARPAVQASEVQARRRGNRTFMFGDNLKEALGLTNNYNKLLRCGVDRVGLGRLDLGKAASPGPQGFTPETLVMPMCTLRAVRCATV